MTMSKNAASPPTTPARGSSMAALIGDVVDSREFADRAALHVRLTSVLTQVNGLVPPVQPLDVTVGDEFQGVYSTVEAAVDASLLVRLHLLGDADTRFGIGWGHLTVLDDTRKPAVQDGPAWWSAREAIDRLKALKTRRGVPRTMATAMASADRDHQGPVDGERAINAYLACRDDLVAHLDPRAARLLLGLFAGSTHEDMAASEGISRPAVTQRIAAGGVLAIWASRELLRGTAGWWT
jgi:hypothetical protein